MSKNSEEAKLRKLRKEFDRVIDWIWNRWGEAEDKLPRSPFEESYDSETFTAVLEGFSTAEIMELFQAIGWVKGVSEARGWPIGPREWSPRV